MIDDNNQVGWTEEQWNQVRKTVADEAQKSRVAAQFLPLFGPVDPSVTAVPDLLLSYGPLPVPPGAAPPPLPAPPAANAPPAPLPPQRIVVSSAPNIALATISVQVSLANHDVADRELMSALGAFRRAANIVARVEDALVFDGQPGPDLAPAPLGPGGWLAGLPSVYQVTGGRAQMGLVPAGVAPNAAPVAGALGARLGAGVGAMAAAVAAGGAPIVAAVMSLIGQLETAGQSGPYACFLSPNLFEAVHTPNANMVMPRDRILPFLGGDCLRRTNTIPNGYGILVALGGAPVELVVASDICVRFLQVTQEPRFLFRVSERLALRVKEWNAVGVLHP